jgi:hypothetical protein
MITSEKKHELLLILEPRHHHGDGAGVWASYPCFDWDENGNCKKTLVWDIWAWGCGGAPIRIRGKQKAIEIMIDIAVEWEQECNGNKYSHD